MFRDLKQDKKKSQNAIAYQVKHDLRCAIDGCNKSLTIFKGPGSDKYCRDHQLKAVEYGGLGKGDRPHTFHRNWICAHCGKDVQEDTRKKYPGLEETDPIKFNQICRAKIIGDHITRQSDGGDDSAANIQSLCLDCNAEKTILNEDYRKGAKLVAV